MLEMRPNCESCDRDLPNGDPAARICTFECTFCAECVEQRLDKSRCPNWRRQLQVVRPTRPEGSCSRGVPGVDETGAEATAGSARRPRQLPDSDRRVAWVDASLIPLLLVLTLALKVRTTPFGKKNVSDARPSVPARLGPVLTNLP